MRVDGTVSSQTTWKLLTTHDFLECIVLSDAMKSSLPTFQKATVPELRMVIKYKVEIEELVLGIRLVSRQ